MLKHCTFFSCFWECVCVCVKFFCGSTSPWRQGRGDVAAAAADSSSSSRKCKKKGSELMYLCVGLIIIICVFNLCDFNNPLA
jgi:hypothetical protein